MIIDTHLHLWNQQHGMVNGKPVYSVGGGRSDFGGEIKQMMPPFMEDGKNTIERLIANMDYAGVNGCVVTQEYIDGNQDNYLIEARNQYPNRLKICSLYEERDDYRLEGFDGIKVCAGRLTTKTLLDLLPLCKKVEESGKFLSIDLADGDEQVNDMEEIIKACPSLPIAIGHFGMVTRKGWEQQIMLAKHPNVYIESGGITWLFNEEFYPYPSAIKAIKRAAEICGMDKLMWGSDYPRTMTAITYKMSYDFISKTQELTCNEKDMFLYKNALKFYQFDNLPKLIHIRNMVED